MNEDQASSLPEPWWQPDQDHLDLVQQELAVEIAPGHPLWQRTPRVQARCGACDEVLVRLEDDSFALVHMTWSGRQESPPWPRFEGAGGFIAVELAVTAHALNHS